MSCQLLHGASPGCSHFPRDVLRVACGKVLPGAFLLGVSPCERASALLSQRASELGRLFKAELRAAKEFWEAWWDLSLLG